MELTVVRNVCPHDCPDTCSMSVGVRDGVAVSLKGDASHPFTRGFLCQKVARYLERVYHPERLMFPQRRVGPKGAGRFERVSWDEAVADIAAKLSAVRRDHGPEAVLPYSYAGTMGLVQGGSLCSRFFHALGASHLDRTICASAGIAGTALTVGTRPVVDPESVVHARTVINWGSNTSVTNLHLWALMHQARKRGATIVTVDPYRTPTAARSDWWLAVRPGTDAALALGVMHVIFREGWQDDDYLHRHCLGADELRDRVTREYGPERVAGITTVSVADIERLARLYAREPPTFLRINYGLQRHKGGGMAARTLACLPAVTGSWKHRGGGCLLSTSRLAPLDGPALERPDLAPPGTRTVNMVQLAEALHGELPGPPVKALVVYNSNPASVCPDQGRVKAGLRRDDLFTVVLEQFPTDTAQFADYLLPATSQLEHWDLHNAYGHLYVQANPPSIAPLGECLPNTEVFRRLAAAMGLPRDLFAVSDEELVRLALRPRDTPHGFPAASALDGIDFDGLKDGTPWRLNLPADYRPFAEGGFATPSGKCHLWNPDEAAAGRDPLPYYEPPAEDPQTAPALAAKYPLQLLSPPHPAFLNSTFANVPSLREQAGEPTLELHPADAERRGIADGDRVTVFNGRGRFAARAVVGESVKPGVAVTLGLWWGRDVEGGANCNATTSTRLTDFGGGATFFDNLVEVARA